MSRTVRFMTSLPWPVHEVSRSLRGMAWSFPRLSGAAPTANCFEVDLRVPVGAKGSVNHRATVELGTYEPGPDICRLPVSISASRSFPRFSGEFVSHDENGHTMLTLAGEYHMPLGVAGRVSGGSGLARASLRRFFETAVDAIKRDLQATAPAWRPHAWPESLRDA
ncbi:MAG: hypothetical protein JO050_00700 [Acidimicrobiia bacterium]|nr:hypothetical protein [Acidimicrobiia bacterium]